MQTHTEEPDPAEAALRAQARTKLARELHDEVIHRVAGVSMQVMGHRASQDIAELRRALDTIAANTADTLAYLWSLDRVLRAQQLDDPVAGPGEASSLPALKVCDSVAEVVGSAAELMRAAALRVEVTMPVPGIVGGPTARRTLAEALRRAEQLICENAVTAPRVTIEVAASPGTVSMRISAPVTGWKADWAVRGMAGLRERVRLTEGTFWSGIDGDERPQTWALVLRLRDD